MSGLPETECIELERLMKVLSANYQIDEGVATEVLRDDLLGFTIDSSHSIEEILHLSRVVSSEWLTKIFLANSSMDNRFLLALLDQKLADKVSRHQFGSLEMPQHLKNAILISATEVVNMSSGR
jgi:hypothetical protein